MYSSDKKKQIENRNRMFSHGSDNAFMLNDCKYLYNMHRRDGMLKPFQVLICKL